MNTYHCEYEYFKATEETPDCLVVGEDTVVAATEDDAKQALCRKAAMHGVDNLSVTKIELAN